MQFLSCGVRGIEKSLLVEQPTLSMLVFCICRNGRCFVMVTCAALLFVHAQSFRCVERTVYKCDPFVIYIEGLLDSCSRCI